MEAIGNLLAGLGFLFIGLRLISENLRQQTGRRVQKLLCKATAHPILGMLSGALAGALTQSSNAVAVINAGLIRAGMITPRQALSIVAGSNPGTALIVFIASIDLRLLILYMIGLLGISMQFKLDRSPKIKPLVGALLGLAFLFLGLTLIKETAGAASSSEDIQAIFVAAAGFAPLAFLLGFGIATVLQSSSTPSVILVAAIQAGLVSLDQGIAILLGANIGSGFATWTATRGLAGSALQLGFISVIVKLSGSALFAVIWYPTILAGIDLTGPLVALSFGSVGTAIAIIFLILQLAGAMITMLATPLVMGTAERLAPPAHEELVSKPAFIYEQALDDPATALILVEKELERATTHLLDVLPDFGGGEGGGDGASAARRAASTEGLKLLAREIEHFLTDVIDRGDSEEGIEDALRLQAETDAFLGLLAALSDFDKLIGAFGETPPALLINLSESLRLIVETLSDAMKTRPPDPTDITVLKAMTGDRSELFDRIRQTLLDDGDAGLAQQRRLFEATGLFERAVWFVGRLAQLHIIGRQPPVEDGAPVLAEAG